LSVAKNFSVNPESMIRSAFITRKSDPVLPQHLIVCFFIQVLRHPKLIHFNLSNTVS